MKEKCAIALSWIQDENAHKIGSRTDFTPVYVSLLQFNNVYQCSMM